MPKYRNWFWLSALAAALLFDFLFWGKPFGISFPIWTVFVLGAGYVLAWREGKKPAPLSILLTLLIIGFALVQTWRNEPFTRGYAFFLTLTGLLLLAATFLNGHWPFYRMWDYLRVMTQALGGALSRAVSSGSRGQNPPPLDQPVKKSGFRKVLPVLRGVLIALPIVAVLAVMLSSADPVFGDWLKKILDLEKLPEYIFRTFYVVIITMLLVGIYLHAIHPRQEEERPDPQKAWMKPFLGWTETAVILAAVDALFLAFVFIQVRYLFGGSANITETGYTYAEYARRGFGELIGVAVLSLLLYLCLNTITKRENSKAGVGFTVLSVLLMANVLVMLVSSYQRLTLYENAYGFSRLRTYTHVCIYWLGALILVTILLELLRKRGHFALALLVGLVGFGVSLVAMNVDAFIAGKNIQRAVGGEELDVPYLVSLSSDAVPYLIQQLDEPALPEEVKTGIEISLACRQYEGRNAEKEAWQSFNWSEATASRLLQENQSKWSQYKIFEGTYYGGSYTLNGVEMSCQVNDWID